MANAICTPDPESPKVMVDVAGYRAQAREALVKKAKDAAGLEFKEVKDEEGTIQGKGSKSSDLKRVGGGAGIGALIGVLTGGGKGAKIGAAVGAIAGGAGTLATRGNDIVLYPDTELVIRLNRDAAVSSGILRRKR